MSVKRVGVVGTKGFVANSCFLSTSELLQKVGANTGNLLFQYAVCKSIDEDYVVIGEDIGWDVALVRDTCKVLVIPSANFVREGFDMTGFVNFLEAVELPLVFVGLGVQAQSYDQIEFDLHPSVIKLLELIKLRSPFVAVRGEFTRKVLSQLGVSNTVVTGCPTNFINTDTDFVGKLTKKWNRDLFSYFASGDEPWPKNLKKRDVERKMISWVDSGPGCYIQQSVEPFIRFIRQSNLYQSEEVGEHLNESLKNAVAPWMSDVEFREFVAVKLRVFYNVYQWLEDCSRVDFAFGMRLHGNMAAWQSGTPAVWIYHDSRTKELSQTMMLPSVDVDTFLTCENIFDLKNVAKFDPEAYLNQRNALRDKLTSVYEAADVSVCY